MLTMPSPILDKNLYTAKKSGDSKNSGDGKVTVTAELPSRTNKPISAANTESGQVANLHPQKRMSRNVERVWRHWHREKTTADGAVSVTVV